jgi:hypothetical protein
MVTFPISYHTTTGNFGKKKEQASQWLALFVFYL